MAVEDTFRRKISLYIKYRELRPALLGEVLSSVSNIYTIVFLSAGLDWPREPLILQRLGLSGWLEDRARETSLAIDSVMTGQSVKFTFKGGWTPSLSVQGDDIQVGLPKSLGVPIIATGLILGAVHFTAETVKSAGEAMKVWREVSKIELESKMVNLEIEEIESRIRRAPAPVQRQLDHDVLRLNRVAKDPDIQDIEVNF
jgi:hypothetical protein